MTQAEMIGPPPPPPVPVKRCRTPRWTGVYDEVLVDDEGYEWSWNAEHRCWKRSPDCWGSDITPGDRREVDEFWSVMMKRFRGSKK